MFLESTLTVQDLEQFQGGDGRRYELIGGAIVMTPAPTPLHQRISRQLGRRLEQACPAGHEVFLAPVDLDLPGGQRLEPDLVVVPDSSVGEKRLATPALLVVEIVSSGSRTNDLITKRTVYAEAGIPAYWIIDAERNTIMALRLAGGVYEVDAQGSSISVDRPVRASLALDELLLP